VIESPSLRGPLGRLIPAIAAAVFTVGVGISMLFASGLALFRVKLFIASVVVLAWSLVPAVLRPHRRLVLLAAGVCTTLGLFFLSFLALVVR